MSILSLRLSDEVHKLKAAILFCSVLFTLSAILGYWMSLFSPATLFELFKGVEKFLVMALPRDPLVLLAFIFLNNSAKAFLAIVLGVFVGVFPILFICVNGYILGTIFYFASLEIGYTKTVLAIAPHGIVEIPALILSSALGVKIGYRVLRKILKKESVKTRKELQHVLLVYLRYLVPMFLIAAIIEVSITPLLVHHVS